LARLRRFLVVPHRTLPRAITTAAVAHRPGRHLRSTYVEPEDRLARERRATQLARFRFVKRLQAAGHNAQAIMRETGLGRTYVRTWIRLEDLPERNRMEPRVGMARFYREYLVRRWAEGCRSVRLLMAEIEPLGDIGGYARLVRLIAPWRLHGLRTCRPRAGGAPVASVFTRHVSPQIPAALLGQPRPLLTDRQADTVDALKAQMAARGRKLPRSSPTLCKSRSHSQSDTSLLRPGTFLKCRAFTRTTATPASSRSS
jgi:hypothetical protein